jgi:hypothetical protein
MEQKETVILEKAHQKRASILEKLIIEESPRGRIEVNWNSFTKIKKKNYLEEYIFNKEIGRGSFGMVIKAKMKYASRYRAIKIIKESAQLTKRSNKLKLMA